MKILTVLTYYRPHTSGLTIFVERLCEALVKQGHEVTILTSQFDKSSAREEMVNGVRIVRAPVWFRISKGVIMPTIGFLATREVLKHDVIHLHLPQFDAPGIALRGRLLKKPTVLTYHSDLTLPSGIFNRIVDQVIKLMNFFAAKLSDRIGAYTEDFAKHSFYLSKYLDKIDVIAPPVSLPEVSDVSIQQFQLIHNPDKKHPVIGMATRFAAEKGVEVLLDALPAVLAKFPNAKVLFAGQFEDVLGEEAYKNRLMPTIEKYQAAGQWEFLGVLSLEEMAEFYPALDVLLVPSLNGTETFGFVQIEAMINGVPTVASNLPGVRQPITMTGMGIVIEIGNANELGEAIINIVENPERYQGDAEKIKQQFSPATAAKNYAGLFQRLLDGKLNSTTYD